MINTLNELKVGDSGVVVSFKGKGSLRKHLMEMGFVKGSKYPSAKSSTHRRSYRNKSQRILHIPQKERSKKYRD